MIALEWDRAAGRRMEWSRLISPAPAGEIAALVGAVCGIQAQVMGAAELAIGARIAGIGKEDVQRALWDRRSIVKTYGPRTTLHLLPAAELPLWMAAMRGRAALIDEADPVHKGLTPEQIGAITAAIGEALDGRSLTREELAAEVSRRVGDWSQELVASNWGEPLGPAAWAGKLVFGPSQGARVTFTRADQWIGGWPEIDPAAALREVCRRYLAAYGPATPQDFARWFWLKPAQAKAIFDALGDELTEVEIEGGRCWMLVGTVAVAASAANAPLRLLPQYDCYVLGSTQRDRLTPDKRRIMVYGRGRFEGATGLPVLLVKGSVAGIWSRKARGKRMEIRVEPFVELDADERDQVAAEAQRTGRFLSAAVDFSFGTLD